MSGKPGKRVLIVEDNEKDLKYLETEFSIVSLPFRFVVDNAKRYDEFIKLTREHRYDVITLDVDLAQDRGSADGMTINMMLSLMEEFGPRGPIRIIFTRYEPTIRQAVEAMRCGAWDYIVKAGRGAESGFEMVVASAVKRLHELESRRKQEQIIVNTWLPANYGRLEQNYSGQIIALWHDPFVTLIEASNDIFELEATAKMKQWRLDHPGQHPYLLKIPRPPDQYFKED